MLIEQDIEVESIRRVAWPGDRITNNGLGGGAGHTDVSRIEANF